MANGGDGMRVCTLFVVATLTLGTGSVVRAQGGGAAGEYARHFEALSTLSVEVAQAMPADQYGFKPHPDSMEFGQLMTHIAGTNYGFCAGLKDAKAPGLAAPQDKNAVVKLLSDSFAYCTDVIAHLTEEELQNR